MRLRLEDKSLISNREYIAWCVCENNQLQVLQHKRKRVGYMVCVSLSS